MSDATVDDGPRLLPRGEEAKALRAHTAGVRAFARARRVLWVTTTVLPCAFAVGMGILGVGAEIALYKRPVAKDRVLISFMSAEGMTFTSVREKEDLTPNVRENVLKATLIHFVQAWSNYTWEHAQVDYDDVVDLSVPALRDRAKLRMTTKGAPDSPLVLYGVGPGAGKAQVTHIRVVLDKRAPYSADALYQIAIAMPGQPVRYESRMARLTWEDAPDQINPLVQQRIDPLGIAMTSISEYDNPVSHP